MASGKPGPTMAKYLFQGGTNGPPCSPLARLTMAATFHIGRYWITFSLVYPVLTLFTGGWTKAYASSIIYLNCGLPAVVFRIAH